MPNNEIKNFLELLYDELPSAVRSLFFVGVILLTFLIIGNQSGLNDSYWLITKESIFNLAFYLGIFTLLFRSLNKPLLEVKKRNIKKKYPFDKINKDYFLGRYKNRNEVYVYELIDKKRKLWITNLQTKRKIWGKRQATELKPGQTEITLQERKINLSEYPEDQKYDEQIDIINPGNKDNIVLIIISLVIITIVLAILYLCERWELIVDNLKLILTKRS